MKELLEEYGGVVVACIMGLLLIVTVTELFDSSGGLSKLFLMFMESIGMKGGGL